MNKGDEGMRRCLGGYGAHRKTRVTWTQRQFNTGFGTMTGSELAKAAAGALGVLAMLAATLGAMVLLNGVI